MGTRFVRLFFILTCISAIGLSTAAIASASPTIDRAVLNGNDGWAFTQAVTTQVIDPMLTDGGLQPVGIKNWIYTATDDDAAAAASVHPDKLAVSVDYIMRERNAEPYKSLMAPIYELGWGAWKYTHPDISMISDDDIQLGRACYGGAAIRMFGIVTGLNPRQQDLDAIGELNDHLRSLMPHGAASKELITEAFGIGEGQGLAGNACEIRSNLWNV